MKRNKFGLAFGKQRLKVLKKVLRNPDKVWNGIKKYFR